MKKRKRPIIFFIIIATIAISIFVFLPKKNHQTNDVIVVETRYDKALKDVCLENYSRKYDGVYEFKLVNTITFSKDISNQKIESIYNNYGVLNAQDLKFAIFEQKQSEFNDTLIVLNNGNYTKNKNNIPIEHGLYFGNEDYSEIRIKINDEYTSVYSISLTGQTVETLKQTLYINNSINSTGQKLYFFEKYYDEFNKYIFTVSYIFELKF